MRERVAFVTSGAKGLGHATVRLLIEAGWNVCFTYGQSKQEAQELLHAAENSGVDALALEVNLFVQGEVEQAAKACAERFGRVDALIHNFGPFVFDRVPLFEYTDEMWHQMVFGNLTNFFWLYRAVLPGMRARKFGRFVTVGFDGAGHAVGWRHRAAYAAAKSGLASLTRSIAKEERNHGITANMVCPGDIRGHHKMHLVSDLPADEAQLQTRSAVGEDVGRVTRFLCDEKSAYLSGTVVEVTGGQDVRTGI